MGKLHMWGLFGLPLGSAVKLCILRKLPVFSGQLGKLSNTQSDIETDAYTLPIWLKSPLLTVTVANFVQFSCSLCFHNIQFTLVWCVSPLILYYCTSLLSIVTTSLLGEVWIMILIVSRPYVDTVPFKKKKGAFLWIISKDCQFCKSLMQQALIFFSSASIINCFFCVSLFVGLLSVFVLAAVQNKLAQKTDKGKKDATSPLKYWFSCSGTHPPLRVCPPPGCYWG